MDILFTAVTAGDPGQVVLYYGEFWTSTRRGCDILLIAISMIKAKKKCPYFGLSSISIPGHIELAARVSAAALAFNDEQNKGSS